MIRALILAPLLAMCLGAMPAAAQSWTVQADELPSSRPWTDPARLAYTFNNDGEDSYAADVAIKYEDRLALLSEQTYFVRGVGHYSNQQAKKQGKLGLEFGLHFEGDTVSGDQPTTSGLYWNFDVSVGYNREAVYADKPPSICTTSPTLAFCDTQHKESVRLMGQLDLFQSHWERTFSYRRERPTADGQAAPRKIEGAKLAYSFQPVLAVFYDEVTNSPVNPATFTRISGSVSGARALVGGAISPAWQDYRLVLRGSYAQTATFQRDAERRSTFDASSHLLSVALDYEFGVRSFVSDEKGWTPSFGVTYTEGQDPLSGRRDQDTVVVAFKLAYRSGQ